MSVLEQSGVCVCVVGWEFCKWKKTNCLALLIVVTINNLERWLLSWFWCCCWIVALGEYAYVLNLITEHIYIWCVSFAFPSMCKCVLASLRIHLSFVCTFLMLIDIARVRAMCDRSIRCPAEAATPPPTAADDQPDTHTHTSTLQRLSMFTLFAIRSIQPRREDNEKKG